MQLAIYYKMSIVFTIYSVYFNRIPADYLCIRRHFYRDISEKGEGLFMRTGPNIYKRKDGRWEARILVGRSSRKKPQYKYIYAHTYREVLIKKQTFLTEWMNQPAQIHVKSAIEFQDIAFLWLNSMKNKWKESTYVKYYGSLNCYILPEWTGKELQFLGQEDYDVLMEKLETRLGYSSINTINVILSGIFKYARKKSYIRDIPIVFEHNVRRSRKEIQVLTAEEYKTLTAYAYTKREPVSLGILISLYQGLRIGEVCALKWEDIDFDDNIIHIRQR